MTDVPLFWGMYSLRWPKAAFRVVTIDSLPLRRLHFGAFMIGRGV